MTTRHVVTPEGDIILPGSMLHAQRGPHAGTHWRLEKIVHNGVCHMLRVSRLVRGALRARMDIHPDVFGVTVLELTRWFRVTRGDLVAFWHKIEDGVLMGFLGLIPLAVYDTLHGGERAREVLDLLLR